MVGNAPHIPGCRDVSLIGERVARSLFSAFSDRVGRPVTITVFPPLSEGRTATGFDRAAATAQRLGAHPSVVTIHEWGHADDGRPWIVTDPQPAESVDTLLTMDGPLEVDRALQVGVLLAGALETAHRAGIVHGDLSPARLVFGAQGEPLLAETGLAEFAVFPGLGALNNPVRYHAPPEVLERTEITPATDVYSLATTVYALLAGQAPQQKPAEITDSNASLLLRILQMPVPPIERPDLPPGLLDVLLGPLSPSPDKRPQQAIDVAWLLQDVQRRAGFALTEPVVLDLDGRDAGAPPPPHARGVAPAAAPGNWPAAPVPPAAAEPTNWPSAPVPPAAAEPTNWPPAPVPPAAAEPTNWPPAPVPPAAADPPAPPFDQPQAPAPTIFPFAEGVPDAHTPPGAAPGHDTTAWAPAAEPPADALWPSNASAEPADNALWPSSWPADDQQAAEVPPWAAGPPPGDPAPAHPETPAASGTDVGPDVAPPSRPPELDELPAWYTDPLPNSPGAAGPGGKPDPWSQAGTPAAADPSRNPTSWPVVNGTGAPGPDPNLDPWHQANGNGIAPPTVSEAGTAPWASPRRGASGRQDGALPGAGDDLRSLFGEVVSDDTGRAHPPPELPRWAGPGDPDLDPLGPPSDRPPIDLSRLDAPLGPSPFLPPTPERNRGQARSARGATAGRDDPQALDRLPRRHEIEPGPSPAARHTDRGAAPSRRSRPLDDEFAPRAPATDRPRRLERAAPRQVVGGDDAPRPTPRAASAGPPALPVIILIVVVAILAVAAAWLVIAGDDAGDPASDRPADEVAAATAEAPTDVQANQVAEGAQVTWTGDADTSYVVTVLAPDQPPRDLPATVGTSMLVPNAELGGEGGRCFTVAAASDAGGAGQSSAPGCTPGASPEQMQTP